MNDKIYNSLKNTSNMMYSKSLVMIPKDAIESFRSSENATIRMEDCHYISIMGKVVKDERIDGVEYETIYANEGGHFDNQLKILVVLKESYILPESFDNFDRGGHKINQSYTSHEDLWENHTYRNLLKIAFYVGTINESLSYEDVDWNDEAVREKAYNALKKYFCVVSILPFPGLAFNGTNTDMKALKEWMQVPEVKEHFIDSVKRLDPCVIYSGGVDLGLYCSYPDIFGWLKGRTLKELKQYENNLTILDKEIIDGYEDVFPYVITSDRKRWINGVHPASRLSNDDIKKIALVLCLALNG